ncbi:penicillin-binding protein 1C [Zoogloea oleivorans]|uniref:peptidoglycan glycosyltransferase n=1 Tax=Zoogloea oleivorans TaxID=1552750 RepID=A0A6C2CYE9_9RHOO|nr:penicillin-binding protein 1C [Zoogloea oleivorans]MBP8134240.1 penicillin-binding protein 1C [Zoogloea sp.]TYC58425.1 penicillin-binding protein 1C [Zoogloea oleivorans]
MSPSLVTPRFRLLRYGLAALLLALLIADRLFPPPLPGRDSPHALLIVARDGTPLRAFPDRNHVWRHPVTLNEVSPLYREALLRYEDRYFRWHPGVNPFALLRAAGQWATSGRIVSGGSTLTMQVARVLEPTPRTVAGKARQILRAVQLEARLSKDEILTLYLNYAPMGGVLEGVEAASRAYLGKPARRLSHAEAALLVVLPQAPSLLRPDRHPSAARAARDKVIQRMHGSWPEADITDALQEPAYAQTLREPLLAPLLAERLKKTAAGRPRIDTTLDPQAQQTVELLLADRLGALPARVSMAALVVDNATLEVRAYAGSADFTDKERFSHVDMVRAQRSPGSTLKPFLYGLALDEGLIHSESLLADVPQSFAGYQPGNFQQSFHGPVSVAEALTKSLNVPAVEVLERLDPVRFVSLLRRGGLKLEFPKGGEPNLAVILGGASTSLEQLVGAYTAFARQGLAGKPRYTPDAPVEEQRMLSAGAAFIIRDLLESGGPMGRAVESGAGIRRGIAWKTGTSFGFRDAWSVGVSDRFTIGVWIGRPDGTPNPGFFGANIAAPLLVDLFNSLDAGPPGRRTPPPNVKQERICWPLGTRASHEDASLCQQSRLAWTLNDAAPPTFPDRLRGGEARYAIQITTDSQLRARANCHTGPLATRPMARWPAVLEPWLDEDLRRRAIPPAWVASCAGQARPESGLKIVGASDGEILRRPVGGNAPLLRLEVRGQAGGPGPGGEVVWLVNGRPSARLAAGKGFEQRLAEPGHYDITVLDDTGSYDRISLSVR